MKRYLLLFLFVISILHTYSQNNDSLQIQSTDSSIDSLTIKLEKLQNSYDYLTCDYNLYRLQTRLDNLLNCINIKANELIINVYHNRYEWTLYKTYLDYYDAYCALYNAIKEEYEALIDLISLKVAMSNFSETELSALDASFSAINKSFPSIDAALEFFNLAIQSYKSKR